MHLEGLELAPLAGLEPFERQTGVAAAVEPLHRVTDGVDRLRRNRFVPEVHGLLIAARPVSAGHEGAEGRARPTTERRGEVLAMTPSPTHRAMPSRA